MRVFRRRACSPISPLASRAKSSMRAGRPLRAIFVMTFTPPSGSRAPVGTSSPSRPQPATSVAVCSSSKRTRPEEAASRSRPSSSATASKTSAGGAPRATSVATRRSAACSSASRASCSRVSLLEIAVATRSVNSASRSSMRSGSGTPFAIATPMWPHASPSTTTGAPAAEPTPTLDARVHGRARDVSATSSIRTGWPVRMCSRHRDERRIVPRPVGAGGERVRAVAPRARDGHAPVPLPAIDLHQPRAQQLARPHARWPRRRPPAPHRWPRAPRPAGAPPAAGPRQTRPESNSLTD